MHTATQRSILLETTLPGAEAGVWLSGPAPCKNYFFSRPSPWIVINFMSKISKFELLLSFWLQIQVSWLRPEHSRVGYAMNIFIFSLFVFLVLNYFHRICNVCCYIIICGGPLLVSNGRYLFEGVDRWCSIWNHSSLSIYLVARWGSIFSMVWFQE